MDLPSRGEDKGEDAEARLQTEKHFIDALIDSLPGILYLYNEQNQFLRWNRSFENVSGYGSEEIARMSPLDFFEGEQKALIAEKIREVFEKGEAIVEAEFVTKSRAVIPFFLTGRRILFDGKPCVIGMGIDISERRQAETALRESERKYRELVEHANSIILRWTRDGRITFLNEFGLNFFGYAPHEIIGQHVVGTIVPEIDSSNRDLRPLMDQILKEPAAFAQNTNENMLRNGERVWIAWTNKTVLDAQGQIVEVLSIGTDITERRRAEDQIAEQAALLDKARDAIIVRSLKGRILFWNQGAETIYGWRREEAYGRNLGELLYADPGVFEEVSHRLLATGDWSGELRHLTKSGQEIVVESRWTLIRDKEGRPKSVLGINTDITEKKKIEAQFLRAQRMESIGTLAGGIAHDLNNILAPIMMSIDILKETVVDEQADKILNTISISAQRGADIVRQVLSFARGIEGLRIEIEPKHLIKDLAQIIQETFPKDIYLNFVVPDESWTFLGDPTQVHQVLINLCVNARDAMPNGGKLSVKVENCELDAQAAAAGNIKAKPGRYVCVTVADEGTGISRENLEKIFEPFFTTKELNKGTGLGLSTVLAIVKSHKGMINVSSGPGNGTVFYVFFPAREPGGEAKKEQLAEANLPRGRHEMVLLVDDEMSIRTVTGETLQAYGYRVLTATNGAEALELYTQHRNEIGAVITDMRMPVLGGSALIEALKKINPEIKIIASSGLHGNGGLAPPTLPAVKHLLTKPYTAATLLRTLRTILEEK